MKKTKIIALLLVAVIMLMGAGYAYWTEALTIKNTVTTGEMNVEFTKQMFKPVPKVPLNEQYLVFAPDNATSPKDLPSGTKTLEFVLKNLYPGASYITWAKIKNSGTIPAVFDEAVVTFSEDPDGVLKNNILVDLGCGLYDKNGNWVRALTPKHNILLKDLRAALDEVFAGVRLEPGEYITLQGEGADEHMTYTLNPGLTGDMGENTTIKFDIMLRWKQHNVPAVQPTTEPAA